MNERDRQWLVELTQEHETPFYVLFARVSQARYFELMDSLRGIGKQAHVCYSVKTNPHPALLDALHKMESGFELVSGRELEAVSAFPSRKIFNSCAATEGELRAALKANALIIIDSLSQAELLAKINENNRLEVGLRVRFDSHRFGFAPNEVGAAIAHLEKLGLIVTVAHAHPGTNCTLSQYRNFISKVAAVVMDYPQLHGIDLGGGLPGKTSLVERKESLESYTQIIREQLGSFLAARTLYMEAGRFLVEDSMILITKVQHVKTMDGTPFALLDGGINALPRMTMSPFRFFALTQTGPTKTHFRLGGPLMFGSDEVGQVSAALSRGDLIAVENCGAYCTELGWNLSRGLPAIVCID